MPGFYYGGFDIKFKSWEALQKGEDFKIIEVNGVNSEPAHIYEPSYSLLKAYRDIFHHMEIIYQISEMNLALGYKTVPLKKFASGIIRVATLLYKMKYLHRTLLEDLMDLCERLDDQQYCYNSKLLNGASIGQHFRHSAEFYLCLFHGIPTQTVNYDERKRDLLIETDRKHAIKTLSDLSDQLKQTPSSFALQLFSNETEAKEKPFVTSVDRELLSCLDHAIHH